MAKNAGFFLHFLFSPRANVRRMINFTTLGA